MFFLTALGVGFLHTLVGPDHYVPFIVIGRARRWGLGRTMLLTFLCGLGHILSSVLLGLLGIAAGAALSRVQGWEGARGSWAGWALFLFGLAYTAWGVWHALSGRHHRHAHLHPDGTMHKHDHGHLHAHPSVHEHGHEGGHAHGHAAQIGVRPAPEVRVEWEHAPASWKSLTPWVLFVIFVLGPCEPLIPLFFASALAGEWDEVALVVVGYGGATLLAMHALVALFWFGLREVNLGPLERWTHALAGAVILLAGGAMVFLGL